MSLPSRSPGYILEQLDKLGPGVVAAAVRIASEEGVSIVDALSRDKHPRACRARQRIIAVTKWSLGLSSGETEAVFGLDHTTVLYHERKHGERLAT